MEQELVAISKMEGTKVARDGFEVVRAITTWPDRRRGGADQSLSSVQG